MLRDLHSEMSAHNFVSFSRLQQVELLTAAEVRFDRQEALLSKVIKNQVSRSNENVTARVIDRELPSPSLRSSSFNPITIRTNSLCQCKCHSDWCFTLLSGWSIFGSMMIRTQANPIFPQSCDVKYCRTRYRAMLSWTYYVPHWVSMHAIVLKIMNGPSISMSITLARIVPPDSDLFRYIQAGDCDGIHQLFQRGLASPGDMILLGDGSVDTLLFALNQNQFRVCQVLLSYGADPHQESNTTLTPSAADMAWNMSFECPSADNDPASIRDMFPLPRNLEQRNLSFIHKIVMGICHTPLEQYLNGKNKHMVDAPDAHGRPPLHWAAWAGNSSSLVRLIAAGADLNFEDRGARSAMHFSCMTSSAACTAILIESGADMEKTDIFLETPLHCACATGRTANVEYLLSCGVDASKRNRDGRTPLMVAVVAKQLAVVRILLAYGADIETLDTSGESAATLAVWVDAGDIVRVLAAAGAAFNISTTSGRTVLHTAARFCGIIAMEALLGVDLSSLQPSARNAQGVTPLELLKRRDDLTPALLEIFGALLLQVERGPITSIHSNMCETEPDAEVAAEDTIFVLAMERAVT